MASINVHMDAEGLKDALDLRLDNGTHFIVLDYGGLSAILPGYDAEAVAAAREMAALLTACADKLDAKLAARQQPVMDPATDDHKQPASGANSAQTA